MVNLIAKGAILGPDFSVEVINYDGTHIAWQASQAF
jgi:hypothetical protein